MKIVPFTSIGGVTLGLTMDDVVNLFGKPTSINEEKFSDGQITKTYNYDNFILNFDKDDKFRLSRITTSSPNVTLNNKNLIVLK